MWQIDNGVICTMLADGTKYCPSAEDIYAQKDNAVFKYKDEALPPLSELGLRFSIINAIISVKIVLGDKIELVLYTEKDDSNYNVETIAGRYFGYVICGNTWRHVDTTPAIINKILETEHINPKDIGFQQYVVLTRELIRQHVEYTDDVTVRIREIRESETIDAPQGLQATLFLYQSGGSKWLDFMTSNGCGSILGDEMGLGKTLQIIVLMGKMKERKQDTHFLVVCPVSLLENWRREIARFYPSLTTVVHYGSKRTGDIRELLRYDVIIMSYAGTTSDASMLNLVEWDLLVIDEAQNIKNPRAKRTKSVKSITCKVPIAVTGTPFENHMTDIWSIVDFVMPGLLGSLYQFEAVYLDDLDSAERLEKLITPLILRRKVKDVAKDLPERIDIPQAIVMSEEEAMLYEDSRISEEPMEELKSMQLAKIQKLRAFCTHPCVYDADYITIDPCTVSTKYQRLTEILAEIFESGEKVIIFTSFRRMIDVMCTDLRDRFGVYTNYIDGSVCAQERQSVVDQFSAHNGPGALILNPKAAGAGLNITCANHVIHYNLEWNPAVEDQASARAFRRGQEKTVFIHRLFYADTIEEIINEKIQAKRLLSDNAIVGNTGMRTDQEYLMKALSATPYKNQ